MTKMFWGFFGCRQKVGHIFNTAHSLFIFLTQSTQQRRRKQLLERVECAHVSLSKWPDESSAWCQPLSHCTFYPSLSPANLSHSVFVCVWSPLPPPADSGLFIWTNFRRHFSLISSLRLFFPQLQTGEELLCQSLCGKAFPAGSALRPVDFGKFWKGERVLRAPSRCLKINHSR